MVIFLFLVVFGLGGYIVYDKLLSRESNNFKQDSIDSSNTNQSYSYNLEKRSTVQAVREGSIEVLVDTDGYVYLYTISEVNNKNELNNESSEQVKINIKNLEKQFKTYSPKGYTYIDGSKELKAYKLDIENVLTTYYVHMGNGGFGYFVFVKEDGKISYLSYSELINNGKIELKVINNLNNVVSVVENTYSMKPYVITSDGRELLLSDYIN